MPTTIKGPITIGKGKELPTALKNALNLKPVKAKSKGRGKQK